MKADQRRTIERSILGVDCPPEAPIRIEGRFPSGELANFPPRVDPARIVVAENIDDEGATLRIDDESHPDFWMQIRIPREYLEALLCKVNQASEAPD